MDGLLAGVGNCSGFSYKQKIATVIDQSTGIITAVDRTVESHYGGNRGANLFRGFFPVRLDIACGVGADEDVIHHPAQDRMSTVGDFFLQWSYVKKKYKLKPYLLHVEFYILFLSYTIFNTLIVNFLLSSIPLSSLSLSIECLEL